MPAWEERGTLLETARGVKGDDELTLAQNCILHAQNARRRDDTARGIVRAQEHLKDAIEAARAWMRKTQHITLPAERAGRVRDSRYLSDEEAEAAEAEEQESDEEPEEVGITWG